MLNSFKSSGKVNPPDNNQIPPAPPSKINIKDLKVGDKVKYYLPDWVVSDTTIGEGKIESIFCNSFAICGMIIDSNSIISKLEPQYKEIPIEKENGPKTPGEKWAWPIILKALKEEKPFWTVVTRTTHHPYNIPETSCHCPKCDKKICGTSGMPIKQIATEPCKECKDKEKPAPKSFKYDIVITAYSTDYLSATRKPKITACGYALNQDVNGNYIEFKNFPFCEGISLNKTYTVEIKEKTE